jgi:hypothetical protein
MDVSPTADSVIRSLLEVDSRGRGEGEAWAGAAMGGLSIEVE